MSVITFSDKVQRRTSSIPNESKLTAANVNEIKASVNALYGSAGVYSVASGVLTPTQIYTLNSGIDLVAAQGATSIVIPIFVLLSLDFNSVAYTTSNNVGIRYSGGLTLESDSGWLKSSQDADYIITGFESKNNTSSKTNKSIQLIDDAIPADGNSNVLYHVEYRVVDISAIT